MEYITSQQAADKWGVSMRRVQAFLKDGRIDDAVRFGRAWMIPKDAEKPRDTRGDWHRKESGGDGKSGSKLKITIEGDEA